MVSFRARQGPGRADKTRDDNEGRFVELSPKEERAAYMPPLQTVSNGGCRGGIHPARVEVCPALPDRLDRGEVVYVIGSGGGARRRRSRRIHTRRDKAPQRCGVFCGAAVSAAPLTEQDRGQTRTPRFAIAQTYTSNRIEKTQIMMEKTTAPEPMISAPFDIPKL